MKRSIGTKAFAAAMAAAMTLTAAGAVFAEETAETTGAAADAQAELEEALEIVITLADDVILVDGEAISEDPSASVYVGADIVYYEDGHDATYGEGDEEDGHSAEEAAAHTVVTITEPGTYRVSGTLSRGQIAIDLGEDAETDENAVVNLILDQVDLTCEVASAIVVYSAFECGSDETETATKDVDTSGAGFHLIVADGSENVINGSHVAKIYKDGTTQEQVDADEAKKKWKFDAAIDSLVSFTIDGEESGSGKLTVNADNEGISSALHMTINGGEVVINSSDDAINASEDYVSVLTINGGVVTCDSGLGKEGDGIDSNGWIVVNGGYTIACANGSSQDSGVDADMGIYINGGTVLASGNMYDEVSAESKQQFLVLNFASQVDENELLMLVDSEGTPLNAFSAVNAFTTMVYSSDLLADGEYTLYKVDSVEGDQNGSIYTNITSYTGEVQMQYSGTSMMGPGGGRGFGGFGGGQRPENFDGEMPSMPEGFGNGEKPSMPEGFDGEKPSMPEGFDGEKPSMPEGFDGEMPGMPEGFGNGETPSMPEGFGNGEKPSMPEGFENGEMPGMPEGFEGGFMNFSGESSTSFVLEGKSNTFSQITEVSE